VDTAASRDTTDELVQNSRQTKKQDLQPKRSLLPRSPRRSESNAVALVARKTTTRQRTALTSLSLLIRTLAPKEWSVAVGLGGSVTESVNFAQRQSTLSSLTTTKKKKQHKENK